MSRVGNGSRTNGKTALDGVRQIHAGLGEAVGFGQFTLCSDHLGQQGAELVEQAVALHLQQFVPVAGLLDPSLELDELASGRLDVERHASSPRSGAVLRVVLRDEFLVKTDEVLRVDAGHQFPAKVEGLGDGPVLVTTLAQEAVLEDG